MTSTTTIPGRGAMNTSMSTGLRRTSFLRSASLRSGLATIASAWARGSGAVSLRAGAPGPAQPATQASKAARNSERASGVMAGSSPQSRLELGDAVEQVERKGDAGRVDLEVLHQ